MVLNIRPMIRDFIGDVLYATGLTQTSKRNKKHPFSIVTFHRVLPINLLEKYPVNGIAVTPEELEWFVDFFKTNYDCNTLAHNYARWRAGEVTEKPLLSITFDDGQLDNFTYARPILNAAQVPSTFFIVTDGTEYNETLWYDRIAYAITKLSDEKPLELQTCLSQFGLSVTGTAHEIAIAVVEKAKSLRTDERLDWVRKIEKEVGGIARPEWDGMMNWEQLMQLIGDGHEIGCHTKSHPILPLCDDAELIDEIVLSRQMLEEKLDIPINSFCFPNGDSDVRSIQHLKEGEYKQAVSTRWGLNKQDSSPFMLKRFDIQGQTSRSRKGDLSASRLAWRLSSLFPRGV